MINFYKTFLTRCLQIQETWSYPRPLQPRGSSGLTQATDLPVVTPLLGTSVLFFPFEDYNFTEA